MNKNPKLKLKYAMGLGDLVACILHSEQIGWLTKLITGKNEPCKTCSNRAWALNILFPFKIWRFYFKNMDEYNESFKKDLALYSKHLTIQNKIKQIEENQNKPKNTTPPKIEMVNGYSLLSSTDTKIGEDYLLRVQTFKLN